MAQYIYGKLVSTGKIIAIGEVPKDRSIRKPWECECPQCGLPLMARRGDKREDHFAHRPTDAKGDNSVLCSPGTANETALHQMAKEILLDEVAMGMANLVVPAIEFDFREANIVNIPSEAFSQIPRKIEYRKPEVLSYTKALLEEWFSGFRPDVIIETADGKYLIEICVTHAVQADKRKMAESKGIPILEIDLSAFVDVPLDRNTLRELVITQTTHKCWVVRPNNALVLEWGRRYYNEHPYVQKCLADIAAREEAQQRREKRFQAENYAVELKQLEGKRFSKIEECWFYKKEREIPFFLNIPVSGEIIFKCDRRVWQGAIFDKFIYNRNSENEGVYIDRVIQWIKKYQNFFDVDWDLLKGSYLLNDVIKTYLGYLADLGFLSDFSERNKHYKVVNRDSIIPLNKKYTEALQSVLASVDKYFPEIDDLVMLKMMPVQKQLAQERFEMVQRHAKFEEKRREEERVRKECEAQARAEAETAKKLTRAKQMILAGEYGSELSSLLQDRDGWRLALCTSCNNITRAYGMKHEPGNLHKGICIKCRRQKSK